jgi:hypothetical protein
MTADDLLELYHGKQALVDDVTSRAESRPHPDFPTLKAMRQFKVTGECKESFSSSSERTRALHWTALLQGQVALEMAQNIESMFAIEASPAAPDRAAGKPKPCPKPRPKKEKKVVTPADARKLYVDALASRCMEYTSIMMEIKAKLGADTWTSGLRQMLDGERSSFEGLHSKFVGLNRSVYTDAELAALVAEFKEHANLAGQYIVAGDNMTNKKNRKLPADPVAPTAPAAEPAAESAAATA